MLTYLSNDVHVMSTRFVGPLGVIGKCCKGQLECWDLTQAAKFLPICKV